MPGEPADMHLVDDRLGEGAAERRVALPVVASGSTTTLFSAVAALSPGCRAASRCGPPGARRISVRVEQDLVRVEAQPARGIEGPGDAIGIDLAGGDARAQRRANSGRCG